MILDEIGYKEIFVYDKDIFVDGILIFRFKTSILSAICHL